MVEPVFQPVEDIGLGFGGLAVPVVTNEQRAFTAAQEIHCADKTVQTTRQKADLCQPVDRQAFRSDGEGSGPLRPFAEKYTPPIPGEKAQHRLDRSCARHPGRGIRYRDIEIDLAGPAVLSVQLTETLVSPALTSAARTTRSIPFSEGCSPREASWSNA